MKTSTYKINFKSDNIYTIISLFISIVLWQVASLWLNKPIIIPAPNETVISLIKILKDPMFLSIICATLNRIIFCFIITLILAVILGMLSGFYKPIYNLLSPIVLVFKSVPTMAVILLAIIWLESEIAPILVGFLVTFPLLYQNIVQGIRNIDKNLIEMVKIYKINKLKIIKEIYLPSIKSYLMAGMSSALGLNVKIIIAAEVLSQPQISIGTSFQIEKANLNTAGVFAWSIIAIVIAGTFDIIIKLLQRKKIKNKENIYRILKINKKGGYGKNPIYLLYKRLWEKNILKIWILKKY